MSNGEIIIGLISTLNFSVLLMIYSLVKETLLAVDEPQGVLERGMDDVIHQPKPQYNESVDPVTLDAETHDYLVRLAKEERE